MMATNNQRRVNPLMAFNRMNGVEQEDTRSIRETMKETLQELSDTASIKVGADVLRSITEGPPPPNPLDDFLKLGQVTGLIESSEDKQAKRQEAKLARERQERLDALAVAAAEENKMLAMMKAIVDVSNTRADAAEKIAQAERERTEKLLERINSQHQESLKALKEELKPKKTVLEELLEKRMLEPILNPPKAIDPVEEALASAKRLSTLREAFGGGGNGNADEWRIKEKELELNDSFRREQLLKESEAKIAGTKQITAAIENLTSMVGLIFSGKSPQPPKSEDVAYGIYVCGVEGCGGQKADALGAESFECPKCHTVQKVAGTR